MTPMIDVVFLLIIFFLVASHLSDQETLVELDLPDAESATPQEVGLTNRITFNIPDENQIVFAGKVISLDEMQQQIQEFRSSQGPDLEVRIRTDRKTSYVSVTPILRACAELDIWNVTFAVYEKRGAP